MKIVVLGANGRTGKLVVLAGLKRGMDVRAVVRSADKKPSMRHNRLEICVGDPCDPVLLKGVIRGCDAVISTLGPRLPTKNATSIYHRSAKAIVDATKDMGRIRLLVTSSALLFPAQSLMEKILRFLVPNIVRSTARMEKVLSASNLDWTFARCGFLNDANVETYRAESGALPENGTSVSRLALAHFLLDAIADPYAYCRIFGVSRSER